VIAKVLIAMAILASSSFGQIPKERLMAYINGQSSRVYYWGVALNQPPDSYQENKQFVPLRLHRVGEGATDSFLIMASGLQSGDSVFFYLIPTVNESGATLTQAGGDTIKYRETSAPPAMSVELARATRKNLDSLSSVLPNFNFQAVKEKHFHGMTENFLAGGSCFVASGLLFQHEGGLNVAVAALGCLAGLYIGYRGLHQEELHSERLKSIEELQKQFPPGF
jgi:hypothetical protein